MPKSLPKPQTIINTAQYLEQKSIEESSLELFNRKNQSVDKKNETIDNIDNNIKQSYQEMQQYNKMYNKIYEQEYLDSISHPDSFSDFSSLDKPENDDDENDDKHNEKEENTQLDLRNLKLTVTLEDVINNQQHTKKTPEHLKAFATIETIVDKQAKSNVIKTFKNPDNTYQPHESTREDLAKILREKGITNLKIENPEPIQKVSFEKNKFLKASWFMKIGHYIGLSLRNQYYEKFDSEIIKALENDQVYKVLEAQKNGYYLGKKLNKLTVDKIYENLTTKPSALLDELVQRDILLSYDQLSLIIFSKEGKELIKNQVPEYYPYAKTLIQDLLKKENFVFANKNIWLNSLKDKELFLNETNPLFYHDQMLSICEKSELLTVKKVLGEFLQEDDVLKSISKNKLIDKMMLKIDILLGNSVELDHMVMDLPDSAQKMYKAIKQIKFNEEDLKILQENHQFDYDLVEKRMPEAVIKYLNVDTSHRNSLKNQNGKTAESLLLETLENILLVKKDLHLFVNQAKISELSVTRRYTDNIRGDIGKPSLFTLKTLQQLKDSGELIDLSNETIGETINNKNASENHKKQINDETIVNNDKLTTEQLEVSTQLADRVKDVRISQEKINSKKLKI